jgi:uncharacterized protein YndB with AHSA1/START domain
MTMTARPIDSEAAAVNDPPVRKSITVKASAARAFEVFTAGIDSWWPRSHHIGKSPMTRAILEGRVLVWEPPRRFVMAWQITGAHWQYEPDITKSSEVEVRFTPVEDGSTRVDLEHRHFNRYGPDADAMRQAVSAPNGWSGLLQLFATRAEAAH